MRVTKKFALVAVILGVSGCSWLPPSTNPEIGSGISDLADQTKALRAAVNAETETKVTVRRDEAIRYWLARGNDDKGTNINSANPRESFARYVCAGSGALNSVNAQMTYLDAYAGGLQAAIEPGPDTFAGQFARFLDRSSKSPKLDLPKANSATAEFRSCFKDTDELLTIYEAGAPASDTTDEFSLATASAVFKAGEALISALESLAKDGLKIVNDVEARAHLKRFVKENREDLGMVLDEFKAKGKLDDAWRRREAFVLGSAYEKFKTVVNDQAPSVAPEKLRASALAVSNDLSAFDKMRKAVPTL